MHQLARDPLPPRVRAAHLALGLAVAVLGAAGAAWGLVSFGTCGDNDGWEDLCRVVSLLIAGAGTIVALVGALLAWFAKAGKRVGVLVMDALGALASGAVALQALLSGVRAGFGGYEAMAVLVLAAPAVLFTLGLLAVVRSGRASQRS